MKKNWLRKLIGGLSFTSALFVFQACYGTPQDMVEDMLVEGQVKSQTSGLPIEGVKISVADSIQHQFTDEAGRFSFYTAYDDAITIRFQDVDSGENGSFRNKDTTVTSENNRIFLNIALQTK